MKKEVEPAPELWEHQLDEPPITFSYFKRYRDLGPTRTIQKVCDEVNKAHVTLDQMSQKWQWVKRCRAWDEHLDKQNRDVIIREVQEMSKRHITESLIFQKCLVLPAEAILHREKFGKIKDFNGLSLEKLYDKMLRAAQVFSSIIDIERKSKGEPSEIVNGNITAEVRVIRPSNLINEPKDKSDNNPDGN